MNMTMSALRPTLARLLDWYDRTAARCLGGRLPAGAPIPIASGCRRSCCSRPPCTVGDTYSVGFVERWPTVEALAAAPLDEVLSALGRACYYARRPQPACLCAGRRLPVTLALSRDEAELLALPGIGPYTAAAIARIAFDHPASAVDGNVERVVARLLRWRQRCPPPRPNSMPAPPCWSEAAVRRLRPGDDWISAHGLHAARAALHDLSAGQWLRRPPAQHRESLPRRAPKPTSRRGAAWPLS